MADLEKLSILIDEILGYFNRLENIKIKSERDLDDLKFDASSMVMFSLLNKTIDLAEEVVKSENLGMPMKYRDLFEMLERKKIISAEINRKMSDLIILRNILSHRYEKITKKQIISAIKDIQEIKKFIESIKKYYKIK